METLPNEIIENIFNRIPIEEALHAKHVSKTWKGLLLNYKSHKVGFLFEICHGVKHGMLGIPEEFFYEDEYDHYDHEKVNYYYTYDTLKKIQHTRSVNESTPRKFMVGSCNGLVCLGKGYKGAVGSVPFLICNPLTRESVFLPDYNYSELPRGMSRSMNPYCRIASGFGYCPLSNQYKVVTIYFHRWESKGHVQVYTVGGGDGWRYIGLTDGYDPLIYSSGVYANRALHWLNQGDQRAIIVFDLEGEKFRSMPLPPSEYYFRCYPPFKLLGGNDNLYLALEYKGSCTDIWVYNYAMKECNQKENNQGKCSSPWIKEFSVRSDVPDVKPFAITRSNEILFWQSPCTPFKTRLYSYDPKTSTMNNLWDVKGMEYWYTKAIPHTQSLVSLKDLGEKYVTPLKDLEKLMLQATSKDSTIIPSKQAFSQNK